jgi:hypothetical protein
MNNWDNWDKIFQNFHINDYILNKKYIDDYNQIKNMTQNNNNVQDFQQGLYSYMKNIFKLEISQNIYDIIDETFIFIDMFIDYGAKINKDILDLIFNEFTIIDYDNVFLRSKMLSYIIYICILKEYNNKTGIKSPLDKKSFYIEAFHDILKIKGIDEIILDYIGVDLNVILLLYVDWYNIPLIYNEKDIIINDNQYFLINYNNKLDHNNAKFILFKYYTGYLTENFLYQKYSNKHNVVQSKLYVMNQQRKFLKFYGDEIERLKNDILNELEYINKTKDDLTNTELLENDKIILEKMINHTHKLMSLIEAKDLSSLIFEKKFYNRLISDNFYIQFLKNYYINMVNLEIQVIKDTESRNNIKNKLDILINEFII